MKKYVVPLLGILLLFFVVKNTFLAADKDHQNSESQSVILNLNQDDFNVLLYSKAKGWVHEDAIPAAKELFGTLAKQNNWIGPYAISSFRSWILYPRPYYADVLLQALAYLLVVSGVQLFVISFVLNTHLAFAISKLGLET